MAWWPFGVKIGNLSIFTFGTRREIFTHVTRLSLQHKSTTQSKFCVVHLSRWEEAAALNKKINKINKTKIKSQLPYWEAT